MRRRVVPTGSNGLFSLRDFSRDFPARFLYPQKRSDGRLKPFSRPFLYFMLRSTGPPRWRVSSVGERGAINNQFKNIN